MKPLCRGSWPGGLSRVQSGLLAHSHTLSSLCLHGCSACDSGLKIMQSQRTRPGVHLCCVQVCTVFSRFLLTISSKATRCLPTQNGRVGNTCILAPCRKERRDSKELCSSGTRLSNSEGPGWFFGPFLTPPGFAGCVTERVNHQMLITSVSPSPPLQVGASGWTMSQELAASSCFPRCTWRHVRGRCPRCGPLWSCRPATLGKAATGRPTRRSLCRSFAVCLLSKGDHWGRLACKLATWFTAVSRPPPLGVEKLETGTKR